MIGASTSKPHRYVSNLASVTRDIIYIYVAPCKTVMPYILSRPYKLSQHWPLTSAACNSALLWSLFQPTSFQWERSRHSSVSGLQDQKSIEMSFFNLNEEAIFCKKKKKTIQNWGSYGRWKSGKSTLRAKVDVFIGRWARLAALPAG